MTEVDNALHAKMVSSAPLVALLGSLYRGQPKIFTVTQVPEGVTGRYITVGPPVANTSHDTKTSVGKVILKDIGCYAPVDGDPSVVDDIAGRVWGMLHRQPLTVEGWQNIIVEASGPMVAPTDKTLYGRIVSVRLTLWHWPY